MGGVPVYGVALVRAPVGAFDCLQPGGYPRLACGDGLAVPAIGAFGQALAQLLDLAALPVQRQSACTRVGGASALLNPAADSAWRAAGVAAGGDVARRYSAGGSASWRPGFRPRP